MKELKRTVEEVYGYEAFDGRRFNSKAACEEYENSAKMVVRKMVEDNIRVAVVGQFELLNFGDDDQGIDILDIKNMDELRLVNQYIVNECYGDSGKDYLLTEDAIGNKVILCWSYDHDYCWHYLNFDSYIDGIKENYSKLVREK